MTTTKLDKSNWQSYFDRLSRMIEGELAEIEVDSAELGVQHPSRWSPLLGITYDKKNDLLEVALDGLDHMIKEPSDIFIEHQGFNVSSMAVFDGSRVRQIIKLRAPLFLPSP